MEKILLPLNAIVWSCMCNKELDLNAEFILESISMGECFQDYGNDPMFSDRQVWANSVDLG